MFIPHSGTGFLPSILFGMYNVEELVLPASENLLVSHFCKGTVFVFSRQIKESICILNGYCGREKCVKGFRWFLGGAGCARAGRSPDRRACHLEGRLWSLGDWFEF